MQPEYYDKRREDIYRLRYKKRWTYQMIGDKYGISRERVRQIIESKESNFERIYTNKFKLKYSEIKSPEKYSNDEMVKMLGCSIATVMNYRKNLYHTSNQGYAGINAKYKEWMSKKLKKKGIENELIAHHHGYNILALGRIKIQVLVASESAKAPSMKNISPIWRFGIRKNIRPENPDFYIFIIGKTKDVFIVPFDAVPSGNTIAFSFPTTRPNMSKMIKYHNAYHLLLA